jgi:hypothetical protein
MEKVSGLQLKWYMNYWVSTTKQIDYGVNTLIENQGATFVTLEREGEFPMPVDLVVTYKDGSKELYYIPLNEMLGNKPVEDKTMMRIDLAAWPWVNPTYTLRIGRSASEIATIEIDPSLRLADIERKNNSIDLTGRMKAYGSADK